MPYSIQTFIGDGSTTVFNTTVPYFSRSDVTIKVDGVETDFTWQSNTTFEFDTAPVDDAVIRFQRNTDLTSLRVQFQNGSTLTDDDLNNACLQLLYACQEAIDGTTNPLALDGNNLYNAGGIKIINVGEPEDATDAATKGYVDSITVAGNVSLAQGYAADAEASAIAAAASAVTAASYAGGAVLKIGDTMTGPLVLSGTRIDEARAVAKASAATVDLRTLAGNFCHISGTTTITAIQLNDGQRRLVQFDGVLTLTHGASLVLPGAANITTAAGDFAILQGDSGPVTKVVAYSKADGTALVSSGAFTGLLAAPTDTQTFTASGTWTRPSSGQIVVVIAGGGGGGGARQATASSPAAGGGAGAFISKLFVRSELASTVAVTVGAGGAGRTSTNGAGTPGGQSSFGSLVTAQGGTGGGAGGAGDVAGLGTTATAEPSFVLNGTTKFAPIRPKYDSPLGDYAGSGGATKRVVSGAAFTAEASTTVYSIGGDGGLYNTGNGSNGTGYSAGGGGGYSAGGDGTAGIVVVLTF